MTEKLNTELINQDKNIQEIMKLEDLELQEILKETYDDTTLPELSPKAIEKIRKYILKISYGSSSWISLICTGENCVYRHACVLLKPEVELEAPIGKECPFERFLAKKWFKEYTTSVKIDENDRVEVSQVNDLVEIELIKSRINAMLASEGLIVDVTIGTDPNTGDIITTKSKHQAIEIKDICDRRKDKILKSLVATRESKLAAIGGIKEKDLTKVFSEARNKINKINQEHEKHNMVVDVQDVNNVEDVENKK